jgi:uncharacterized protein (TIGR02145 family)
MKKIILLLLSFYFVTRGQCQELPNYVPVDSLIAWWSLNGHVNDDSGNGNNGFEQLADPSEDRFGVESSAYSLGAVGSQIGLTPSNAFLGGSDYTISFWFRTQSNGQFQAILSKRPTCMGGDENFIEFTILPNSNTMSYTVSGGGFEGTADFLPGAWNHAVYTRNANLSSLFMNGNLVFNFENGYSVVPEAWLGVGSINACISLFGLNERRYQGDIDDIGVWNRALAAWEVADLFGSFTQPMTTYYLDSDGDGYGDESFTVESDTGAPMGYVFNNLDCNDAEAGVYPGATCDDLNPSTENDVINLSCSCFGELIDVESIHTCGADFVHNPNLTYGSVTDQEGNEYKTIVIGDQEWMAENLKTSHYRNGDLIPTETDNGVWSGLTTGATCWYNNDSATYDCPYGKLYNWHAVADARNLCPSGWHVPSETDWSLLSAFLGGASVAGGKMKSTDTSYWISANSSVDNSSGFSGLPSGYRVPNTGTFFNISNVGFWWSTTQPSIISALYFYLTANDNNLGSFSFDFGTSAGYSVRCMRDANTGLIPGCTDPLANNYNPLATINEGCEYTSSNDTLFCTEITTPLGPGLDWAFWIEGLSNLGLASTDYYEWTNWPSIVFSDNGQARLVGDVVALNNPANGWHVDITLYEGMDWASWSANGGLYMDNLGMSVESHTTWNFYKLAATISRLDGFGDFEGDELLLTHQPSNHAYGYQFGVGANNRNFNNGGSGMFFYSGVVGGVNVNGHGDLTMNFECGYTNVWPATIFVYNDLNGNGTHEEDEPGLGNWPVLGNDINGLVWTNSNGNVFLPLTAGQYEFTVLNTTDNWINTSPNSVTIDLTSGPATAAFGMQAIPGEAAVTVSPYQGFADIIHCTNGYESGVYLENIGSQTVSGFMTLSCDPLFTPGADSYFTTPPIETGPGYALWNIEDFMPGEFELLTFHIAGPGVEYLNQSFTFDFDITLLDPQGNVIYNDNWSVTPIVACAYDPNDITGFPEGLSAPHEEGYTIEHFILPDNMVEFRVRFQNTGTLPAEDIDIYIPIDPNRWELSTIYPLMRSAEMQVVCLHDDGTVDLSILEHELPEGVVAEDLLIFSFEDIFLPDSVSDEQGSHGYVFFQMRAKEGLLPGDEINAQAFIYFEQNPPIMTNETYHVIFDCNSFTPMTGDAELCAGDDLLFSASQPYVDEYAWNINGLEGSNNIFIYEGIEAGDYTLQLNTSNVLCPLGEDHEVNITVHELPTLDLPLDATVCEGASITFDADSDGNVSWSNGANTDDIIEATESFTVTATSVGAGGCNVSEDWSVTVNALPNAVVDIAGNVLTAQDGTSWLWTVNGVDAATTQSITAEVDGNYQVVVTNEFGCTAESDVIEMDITSTLEFSLSNLTLYPNPMNELARLELPKGTFDIALYDMIGACVRVMANQQGTVVIERESLTSGVYQVRITQGDQSKSLRLVVE